MIRHTRRARCAQHLTLASTAVAPVFYCTFRRNLTRALEMKANTHPEYHEVKVTCSCGNVFETRSTFASKEMQLDVCSQCHPFYTGKQKMLDTAGQVDKFRRRYGF
jgi:large subunit ribosomal protein L31